MAIFNGTDGNDTLVGSAGNVDDALNGDLGNDVYRYSLGSGNDVISDTGGADTIELSDPLHPSAGGTSTAVATTWSSTSMDRGNSRSRISSSAPRSSKPWLSPMAAHRTPFPIC